MEITLTTLQESASGREVIKQVEEAKAAELKAIHEAAIVEKDEAIKAKDEELTELKEAKEKAEGELKTAQETAADFGKRLCEATLVAARANKLESLREAETVKAKEEKRDADHRLVDMVGKRITEAMISLHILSEDDKDFTKSVASLGKAMDDELETLTEMAKNFGGPAPKDGDEGPSKVTEGDDGKPTQASVTLADIFGPTLKEREGDSK